MPSSSGAIPAIAEGAAVSFNKPPAASYFSITRFLATGHANGELKINDQLLSAVQKAKLVAIVAFGGLADVLVHILSVGALAAYTAYQKAQISHFNELPGVEQAALRLSEATEKCVSAARAFQKAPHDHQKNLNLRAAIRETSRMLQLSQFMFPESSEEFEQDVRDSLATALAGQVVTLKPNQKDDAHSFDYPLGELLCNGFYPVDAEGVSNPYLQGVSPASVTFRFEDGIFAPSQEGILDVFYQQAGVNLHRAIGALTKNLDAVQRPQKKDRDQVRESVLKEVRKKMTDKTSPEFARMAEGAARHIARDQNESTLSAIRQAIFQTGLKKLCKQLAKEGILSEDRQGPLKSAIQRFSEVSSTRKKIVSSAKALTCLAVAGAAATKAPVVGPFMSAAATGLFGKGMAAAGFGASKTVDALGTLGNLYSPALGARLQTMARAGGSYASRAVASGAGMVGAAGRSISSAATQLGERFPAASDKVSTVATAVAPYALPAVATAVAGVGLYKAYKYATSSGLTTKEQVLGALTKTAAERGAMEKSFKNMKKMARELPASPEQEEAMQAVRDDIKAIEEFQVAAEGAKRRADADPRDMNKLNVAHAKAKEAHNMAVSARKRAVAHEARVERMLAEENKEYFNLDDLFKRANKRLKEIQTEVNGLGKALISNDKRQRLEKKLAEATKLLDKFERTKLPQVKKEFEEVAALEQKIQTVLQQRLADPSKKYDQKLEELRAAKADREKDYQDVMGQYQRIKADIERLKKAIQDISSAPKPAGLYNRLFG